MKRDVFVIVVLAFAIFSAFVFYLDSSKNCGSVPCISNYISTGQVKNAEYKSDSLIDKIIYPFVNPVNREGPLFQPGPADPPIAPANLVATVLNDTAIYVTWNDLSSDELEFILQFRVSGAGDPWTDVVLSANTVSYFNTGLIPNTLYEYQVYASNGLSSPPSNLDTESTRPTPTIASLSPASVINDVQNEITVASSLGYNFTPGFRIDVKTDLGNWIGLCVDGDGSGKCTYVDNQHVKFKIDAGIPVRNYEIAYRDYSVGGPIGAISNPLILAVQAPIITPIITNINPASIQYNVDRTITLTGTGFRPLYNLMITDSNFIITPFDYCTVPRSNCNRLSDNTFTFNVPAGLFSGDYLLSYVNLEYPTASLPPTSLQIIATSCLDGEQQLCANQNNTCAGSKDTCVNGVWPGCTSTTYFNHNNSYNSTETGSLCSNRFDDDCDGQFDYDGNGLIKGDNGCPVQINTINAPSPVTVGTPFTLQCTSTPGNVRSVTGSLNGISCGSISSWNGNTASFNCIAPSTQGSATTTCSVDTTYSYQTGNNLNLNIQVNSGTCSGYTTNSTCNAVGTGCEWCIGCSGNQSSGGPDRCVSQGTCSVSYQCRNSGQFTCGATCNSAAGCSSSQICNLNSCGCVEQRPSITSVNPPIAAWTNTNSIIINGDYFAGDSQIWINNVQIDSSRITRGANTLSFTSNSREFNVGPNSVIVRNPTSNLQSDSGLLVVASSPVITALIPNVVTNNDTSRINITGSDFDSVSLIYVNNVLDITTWVSRINDTLMQIILPSVPAAGDYSVSILGINGFSNSKDFRINFPFNYSLGANFSVVSMNPNESFASYVEIVSSPFMAQESVSVSAQPPLGLAVDFIGADNCIPNELLSPPSCRIGINISTLGNLAPGQYNLTFSSTSSITSITGQLEVVVNVGLGTCGDGICNAGIGETCNTCSVDCGPCNTGNNGGSSGGGGGGGGSGGARPVLQQCQDRIDNDGDGRIDYPADKGCTSATDTSESDPSELVNSNYTLDGSDGPTQTPSGGETRPEGVKIVFWIVLIALIGGIVGASVVIIRSLMQKRKFKTLSSLVSSGTIGKSSTNSNFGSNTFTKKSF